MGTVENAAATQLRNIEKATGRSVADWAGLVADAGLDRHGQIVDWLKSEHGLGHGNANTLAHKTRELAAGGPPPPDDLVAAQYGGAKSHLKAIHDVVVAAAVGFGADVDVSPKKTTVSLRRGKQFALIEAPSSKRVVLGFNAKSLTAGGRLTAAKGMCSYQVVLTSVTDVDDEVLGWLRAAYDEA